MGDESRSGELPSVEELILSLPERFRPDRAGDLEAVFHLQLEGGEPADWTVHVTGGRCESSPGLHGAADCVVRTRAATWVAVETGRTSPQTAFLTGRIRVSDLALMRRFVSCFRPHHRAGRQRTAVPPTSPSPVSSREDLPLAGVVVLDLSRMLPGAVLARQLLDLGARLVKVEDPDGGDPMRHVPPLADDMGAGFATLLRGAESLALDLSLEGDAERLRRLVGRADVVVDSFRPGTLEAWGLHRDRLVAEHPRLVWCSLPAFGRHPRVVGAVAHDLNLVGITGLLAALGTGGVPAVQLADVGAGLLAASSILAALLRRERTGRGGVVDQPLVFGPLPFLAWALADGAAGHGSLLDTVLAGRTPAYRRYRCGDGLELSVACLEPKFWSRLVRELGLPDLAGDGLDAGEDGLRASEALSRVFATRPRRHWLELAAQHRLPLGPVHDLESARADPLVTAAGLLDATPLPGGGALPAAGPFHPSLGRAPSRPAPRLGEHTDEILAELPERDGQNA